MRDTTKSIAQIVKAAISATALLLATKTANADLLADCKRVYDQQEWSEAIKLCKRAADKDNAEAAGKLAFIYENGMGVEITYQQSIYWWTKAANTGDPYYQSVIGTRYYRGGQGVVQDYKKAFSWYLLAAKQDYDLAQMELSRMYERGQGVQQDNLRAYMWANIASRNGWLTARRDSLAGKLDPKALNRAQEMTRKCLASNYKSCD